MKQTLSEIGFRLRALRESRHHSQESLASECRQRGFSVSRNQLAKYELGLGVVPARFIPVFSLVLDVGITDLLPPLGGRSESKVTPLPGKIRNLTGRKIQAFRKMRKWTQSKLAITVQELGVPMTREIIANLETQRSCVTDYQLVFLAKALQIPLNSLFPGTTNLIEAPHISRRNSSLKKPLLGQPNTNNSIPGPLARLSRTVSGFAKKFISRRLLPSSWAG